MLKNYFSKNLVWLICAVFLLNACANRTITKAGTLKKTVVIHKNDFQKLVFESGLGFERSNFQYIFKITEDYLENDECDELKRIYVEHLRMYLYTYHQINFDKAFELGSALSDRLSNRIKAHGVETLDYDNTYTRRSDSSGAAKLLAGVGFALGLIIIPFTLLATKEKRKEIFKKQGFLAEKATGTKEYRFELQSEFAKHFFLCNTCELHKDIVELLVHINEIIGEEYNNKVLLEKHRELCKVDD